MIFSRSRLLALMALAVLTAGPSAFAQIEVLSSEARQEAIDAIPAEIKACDSTPMAAHLKRAKKGSEAQAVLASRVATDFAKAPDKAFVHYAVPPMSNVQRLPDVYPFDGEAGGPVRIFAAKGEYEPGSFLVYPLRDLGKVSFTLTPFKTKDGKTFPADKLDLKLVKVWYQNRNAWYSYFGDTGFKLVPELLVNDEDLIRVDTEKQTNYARLTDKDGSVTEKWINPPRKMDGRFFRFRDPPNSFLPMKADFRDAKTLQPVLLEEGSFKNFFLTAHVTKDVPEGIYKGAVKLTDKSGKALGEIPVALRVLPFELPKPMCYFNPEREYLTASYNFQIEAIMKYNGGDRELAEKQFEAALRDQVEHGQTVYWLYGDLPEISLKLDIMKRVGMRTDHLICSTIHEADKAIMEADAKRLAKWFDQKIGHHDIFLGFGDEPGAWWLVRERPLFEAYQREGFKFIIAGCDMVFSKAGYIYNWHNINKDPSDSSTTTLWNQLGNANIAWYARMHVGPENPAFNRMEYGMAPYLAGYSATCNYAHFLGPYNDDTTTYRPMVFCYGIYDGVLDTIQWEGYREGIDDIRYATLMTSLARQAAKSKDINIKYAGLKALQRLATFPYKNGGDLNALRLEMIRLILQLHDLVASK